MIQRRLLLTAAAFLSIVVLFASVSADAAEPRRVLLISAYHPGFPSFFKQVEGLRAGLADAGYDDINVVLDVEFMDTKRFSPRVRFAEFAAEIGAKLKHLPRYDVVVAADDNAFRFVAARGETLFRGAPLVFLGVGNLRMAEAEHRASGAVGVIESPSQRETLILANRLFPKAPRIHAVVDGTPTGRMIHRQLLDDIDDQPFRNKINVISLETLTHDGFFRVMAGIPADEPVLLRSAFRDSTGATREFQDILQNIRSVYQGAIFSVQEHGLGAGILGGRVISHVEQGRAAARLTARILEGAAPSSLDIVRDSPNVYTLDYGEMARLNISDSALPAGSVILNAPRSLLNDYREWVIAAAAAILILMGVIAALIVGVVRLRRAERQIEAARRTAETANRAKSEFLARMSHELRTPLNAIIGFSTLLSEDDRRELPADVREYAGYILKGGRILLGLVNEVLDLARIEAGRNEIDIVMVPAAEVVEECVVMARSLAAHTDIVVEAPKLDRNLPLVLGDRARVGQVLLNLLSNAVKYNRPQCRVVLEVSQPSPEIVRFTVADTGKGIPADLREKVFEPFDRLGAESGTIEGTGIGLTIARRLLEMMDGSIDFESREGEGSRFWFDLPAGSAAPAAERKSTRTLLYIESNPAHADLAKAVVGQIEGWSLQVARSVDSAEWLSRREKPDAVLVAFDEGTGDEDDAVALLRGATGSPDLPVFALSIGGGNDAGRAIAAGYDACLGRPLDVETLQAHLSDSRIAAARAA